MEVEGAVVDGGSTAAVVGGDHARALAAGEEGPDPADDHRDLVGEADQEEDVHQQPRQPGEEAAELDTGPIMATAWEWPMVAIVPLSQ